MNAMNFTRGGLPLLLAAAVLGGCEVRNPLDNVGIHLAIQDAPVTVNSPAIAIVAGQATQVTTNVSLSGGTVTSVDEISAIKIQPSFLTFTPGSSSTVEVAASGASGPDASFAAGAASGVVILGVESAGFPLLSVRVTVTNDVVTAVDPSAATLAAMTASIRANAAAIIAANPALAARFQSWTTATADQILAEINALLTGARSGLTISVTPISGNLNGSMRLSQFQLSGEVSKDL